MSEKQFAQMVILEEEAASACKRHPDQADVIFHGFELLSQTQHLVDIGNLYRSHVRELLERIATGADTRPVTIAEIVSVATRRALGAPDQHNKLYEVVTSLAGHPELNKTTDTARYEEREGAPPIDERVSPIGDHLAVRGRLLGDVRCDGKHYGDGEPVTCRYAT